MVNNLKIDVKEALPEFYLPFSGYVIQTRALPSAEDGLKTGARFILYAQMVDKLTYDKPRRKGVATIGAGMRFSPHGDASILGTAVRMSQTFSLRYPVIECQGNGGSQIYGDDYSAERYIELRSNKLAHEMTSLLDKDTIDKWKLNYTQEEKYPSILPTKFPFGLVNGNTGIGVGCASSIPQFNLREVCDKLIYLLNNPDADFNDLYCPPDFATGGILINEAETKRSLANGKGKSILLRAVIEYNQDKNELIVKELPYQVFTSTVCKQIQNGIDKGKIAGIDKFFDGTDRHGLSIRITLTKTANAAQVCKQLYKETSLQHHFSVNMMALKNNQVPMLFSWSDLMNNYLNHLKTVMYKAFQFDYNKVAARMNILDGYLIALANIDDVVKTIKESSSVAQASQSLISEYGFNEAQAKAILDLKLQRLVGMEKIKIEDELKKLAIEAARLKNILDSTDIFKQEVEKEIVRIKTEYGDARRTQIMNLNIDEENDVPIEEKSLIVHITNLNNIYSYEDTTLITQRRGGVGNKLKLEDGEYIKQTINASNMHNIFVFSNLGKVYNLVLDNLVVNTKQPLRALVGLEDGEMITNIISDEGRKDSDFLIFITSGGLIKKTPLAEYKTRRTTGVAAIKLKDNDTIISVFPITNSTDIGITTKLGQFVMFDSSEVSSTGRISSGVKAVALKDNDSIIGAIPINNETKGIITITKNGFIKQTSLTEFVKGSRANRGVIVQKLSKDDSIAAIEAINKSDREVIISSTNSTIKMGINEIPLTSRAALGSSAMKLKDNQKITGLQVI